MKCIFPGANIKVFSKAIQALAKVGEELYLEPKENELILRTINLTKSAFASFSFKNNFFSFYKHTFNNPNESPQTTDSDFEENNDCKVLLKACLYLFRNSVSAEKTVESCQISWDGGNYLVFELQCRFGVKRLHKLPIIECESLQANFETKTNSNRLRIQSSHLSDAIHNFQSSNDIEISFDFTKDQTLLRNYAEDDPDGLRSGTIRTELSLSISEFDEYIIKNECNITFCLRDLKALLGFAVALELPIQASFEQNGAPIVFEISDGLTISSSFVMSTLSSESCSSRSVSIRSTNVSKRNRETNKFDNGNQSKRRRTIEINHPDSNNFSITSDSPMNNHQESSRKENNPQSAGVEEVEVREGEPDQEEMNDLVAPSPEPAVRPISDKIRRIFRRCFEATFDPSTLPGHDVILAPNSSSSEDENE